MAVKPDLYSQIVDDIGSVAAALETDPESLTKAVYLQNGLFTDHDLRKLGGYTAVLAHGFGTPEQDLERMAEIRGAAAENRKLKKQLGDVLNSNTKYYGKLAELLKNKPPALPWKGMPSSVEKYDDTVENLLFISDTHFGRDIHKYEVNSNEYTWKIASRRLSKLVEYACAFREEHRKRCPQLRLCLGGDLMQGVIHNDSDTDIMAVQLHGTNWLLTQAIERLRNSYSKVIVECTTDNHSRYPEKKQRKAVSEKYDQHSTTLYTFLKARFADSDPNVVFHTPLTPFTEFKMLGHSVLMTHGDTYLNVGSVGSVVDTNRITNAINRLPERPALVLLGHYHSPLHARLPNKVELIVNGSGSGTEPFGDAIGYHYSDPCQFIFESTKDHVVGKNEIITLEDADNDSAYDKTLVAYDPQAHGTKLPPRTRR